MSKDIADSLGLDRPAGALVSSVVANSPAEQAGLRRGDVILSVDALAVDDPEAFGFRLGTRELGGAAELGVLRDGRRMSLRVRLAPAPYPHPPSPGGGGLGACLRPDPGGSPQGAGMIKNMFFFKKYSKNCYHNAVSVTEKCYHNAVFVI